MQIEKIKNNYNQPSFKVLRRSVRKVDNSLLYCNDTWFFRDGVFWDALTEFLKNKFNNVSKVNVYSYGCSDGSEAFSFALKMLTDSDSFLAKKFLPIIAKDRDEYIINSAKTKKHFQIKDIEKDDIDYFTNGNYDKYFYEKGRIIDGYYAQANQKLYDNVLFSVADIVNDYVNIKPDNSVVFVRNFWPYIKDKDERQSLLDNLAAHLNKNSLIIIGDYDLHGTYWSIEDQILNAGFQRTIMHYVFEKK